MTNVAIVLLLLGIVGCRGDLPPARGGEGRSAGIAQSSAMPPADSARAFVQRFYDWYVPLANGPATATRYDSVVHARAELHGPAVVADVEWVNGRWRFANFHGGSKSSYDLLAALAAAKRELDGSSPDATKEDR